jgi:hypothetical protein
MKTFTVFGIYADNMQRHSNHIEANNPDQAECAYRNRMGLAGHDMLIAAVVEGHVMAVESNQNAETTS